jgi:hypothetical protein
VESRELEGKEKVVGRYLRLHGTCQLTTGRKSPLRSTHMSLLGEKSLLKYVVWPEANTGGCHWTDWMFHGL